MIKLKSLITEGNESRYIDILNQKILDIHDDNFSVKREFFKQLISSLKNESKRLTFPRYMEFVEETMLSRVEKFDKEFDIKSLSVDDLYNKMDDPKSPIRNGLLLVGLYMRYDEPK